MSEYGEALAPGTRIAEFEVVKELGEGGFGITYLAEDTQLDRAVAMKEYLPQDWGTRRFDGSIGPRTASVADDYRWGLDRFLGEARTLARLNHSQIVRVYRVIEAGGTAYLVMEYVDGRSLKDELKAMGRLDETRGRSLLDGLTAGLQEVHGAGLLHRDIKPANVMLRSRDGSPVLIDFGSARQQVGKLSRSLTAVLTPGYAPIEQYSSRGHQGPWTDIYALGAIAYRAISGRRPEEAIDRMRIDRMPRLEELVPQVSEGLARAIHAALAVYEEDRPQDLAAWREMLEERPVVVPVIEKDDAPDEARVHVEEEVVTTSPPDSEKEDGTKSGLADEQEEIAVPIDGAAVNELGGNRRLWLSAAVALVAAAVVGTLVLPNPDGSSSQPLQEPVEPARVTTVDSNEIERPDLAGPGETFATLAPDEPLAASVPATVSALAAAREDSIAAVLAAAREDSIAAVLAAAREDSIAAVLAAAREDSIAAVLAAAREDSIAAVLAAAREDSIAAVLAAAREDSIAAVLAAAREDSIAAVLAAAREDSIAAVLAAAREDSIAAVLAAAREDSIAAVLAAAREDSIAAAREDSTRAATEDRWSLGRVFRDCSACPEMVVVPPGTFLMGSPASEQGRDDDEGPQHPITVATAFAVGVYEVTFAEWDACFQAGGCGDRLVDDAGYGRGRRPVINVSWENAQAYLSWLSQETGVEYRLATEAEWEYLARAGTVTARYWGASPSGQCENANGYDRNGHEEFNLGREPAECSDGSPSTAPVGSYGANAFGIYDSLGNVWEWTQDCWRPSYAGATGDVSAWESGECSARVLRGGSWADRPGALRSSSRFRFSSGIRRSSYAGFRVVRSIG